MPLDSLAQREVLAAVPLCRSFEEALASAGHLPLRRVPPTVLQVNVGRRCNQTCRHCHVDAGPDRAEMMTDAVVDASLRLLDQSGIPTLDITGGAPELHPRFRDIVGRARSAGCHVMHRCNLTLTRVPAYADLPEFLASHQVEVVASLPSICPQQTDTQRGEGVFEASIAALRRLNGLGYGQPGSGLVLTLVSNPSGTSLPACQQSLEEEWHRELHRRHGVVFNRLCTMTNMPVSRFLEFLVESGALDGYMQRLAATFNAAAVPGLMCRYTMSVGWDGRVYDCDFNQAIGLGLAPAAAQTVFDLDPGQIADYAISLGPHCFGCTAGSGSSCGGTTTMADC